MLSECCALLSGCYAVHNPFAMRYPNGHHLGMNRNPFSYYPTSIYSPSSSGFDRPVFVGNSSARSHRVNRFAEPYFSSQLGCREPVGLRTGFRSYH